MSEGATVYFVETAEGWRIAMRFDDGGQECMAEDVFPSKQEAQDTFNQWCREIGAKPQHIQ